jgi:hypothetical protein
MISLVVFLTIAFGLGFATRHFIDMRTSMKEVKEILKRLEELNAKH